MAINFKYTGKKNIYKGNLVKVTLNLKGHSLIKECFFLLSTGAFVNQRRQQKSNGFGKNTQIGLTGSVLGEKDAIYIVNNIRNRKKFNKKLAL